ncbi:MAG: thioredoxin-dependent thiol peroxidase [Bacteroidetes bacterium]|nr:thioredoxin-dependent thiol peroxidase [Bacteroidota bacterium]
MKKNSLTKTSTKKAETFVAHTTHLKPGNKAPGFSAKDQNGQLHNLKDYADKILVLYFYPKDNTSTCTVEACNLRDEYKFLGKKNFAVVGVSADSEKSHSKFAGKYSLPFPLLVDEDMKIIAAYDVWGKKQLFGKKYEGIVRTTFIIENGKIKEVIKDVDSKNHAQQIIEAYGK